MENKMKKLIALFAVTSTLASTGALASIALSGSASVSYDDNGSAASGTTYDADLTIVGTAGGTTVTVGCMDVEADSLLYCCTDLATTIGPVTIAADMFQVDEVSGSTATDRLKVLLVMLNTDTDDTSVTVSLDVPVGDATIGLDDSGDITPISGTFSGVTLTHTSQDW